MLALAAAAALWAPPAEGQPAARSFAAELAAAAPAALPLPAPILETLDWLEAQGALHPFRAPRPDGPRRWAGLYPPDSGVPEAAQSLTGIFVHDPFFYDWPGHDPAELRARLFLFVRTGGDGSQAGLWLDDDGRAWFVHIGSGSGSDWWGAITDDPLAFLAFLAIGYREPAFHEHHPGPPDAVPPAALRAFLRDRFGIATPDRALGLIATPAGRFDAPPDAFARWLRRLD